MTEEKDGQMSLFDQDIWCGKMSAEHSVPMTERTSESSLKKPQELPTRTPLYLDLTESGKIVGLFQEPLWEMGGALLGEYTMHSFGEFPKEERESLLSQILEDKPHPKYYLSETACRGILNRAEKRGKELPPLLKEALEKQASQSGGGSITPTLISGQHKQCGNTQDGLTVITGVYLYNQSQTGEKTMSITGAATDPHHIPCVACGVDVYNQELTGEKAATVTSAVGGTNTSGAKVLAYGFDQGASRDVGKLFCKETAKAVTNGSCPGHHNGVVTYGIDRASFNQGQNAKYDFAVDEELSQTLVAKGPGGGNTPLIMAYRKKAHPMNKEQGQGWEETTVNDTLNAYDNSENRTPTIIKQDVVVRRLTPLECERLQGFPDGWTDIGDWVDSKGKKHKAADSPRYKALGNSIALPFWEWMAERMCSHLEEPTMASLFDGIGGFPLVYQRCGCEPIWASEIEEFPIAVTKLRFGDK